MSIWVLAFSTLCLPILADGGGFDVGGPDGGIPVGGTPDGGGIKDSVFRIKEVAVVSERIFVKEEAGMKQSRVDTVVLRDKANLSLSQLLSENTPVFIKEHGRGALATASFRGTAASHTQVNWNGININNPMAGMVDFSLIPVYIVDDLNLKHGSASLADRSGGLGGSINIENSVDWQNRFGLKYMQGIGSYSTFDEFLSVGFGGSGSSPLRAYTIIIRGMISPSSTGGSPMLTRRRVGSAIRLTPMTMLTTSAMGSCRSFISGRI